MKIHWEKTVAKMKEAGVTAEEIEEFRRQPVATLIKLLDQGKKVPITFYYKGLIVQLEGDLALQALAGTIGI